MRRKGDAILFCRCCRLHVFGRGRKGSRPPFLRENHTVGVDFVLGLKCRLCGKSYPNEPVNFCTDDFGPLEVDYDYDAIREAHQPRKNRAAPLQHVALSRAAAARRRTDRRPAGGRHAAGQGRPSGQGARRQARSGSRTTPSISRRFRSRIASSRSPSAKPSSSASAPSAAPRPAISPTASPPMPRPPGWKATSLCPRTWNEPRSSAPASTAPRSIGVTGTYDEVNRLCTQVAFKYGWGFVNINLRPFYAEGSKTMGYEIAEQLGWRVPQHVVVPDGRRQPDRQDPQGVR